MPLAPCPKCATNLRVPDGATGAVRCPKCQTVFSPPKAQPAFEVVDDAPAPPPKPPTRPAAAPPAAPKPGTRPAAPLPPKSPPDVVDAAPSKPKVRALSRDDEDDDRDRKKRRRDEDSDTDDDRPRTRRRRDETDDDDRPRGRRRGRDDYDDYDRPAAKAGGPGLAKTGLLLLLISLGLYLGSIALHALFALLGWMGASIPYGLHVVTGLIGLGNWVVAIVGLGMCIAGPVRSRGLAIAATSVAAVHLILALVAASNTGGGFGEAGLNWGVLITLLPHVDRLVAVLAYSPRSFEHSAFLVGFLGGLAELARFVLVALLVGSLARGLKAHGAADQAKFGMIGGCVAVGVGLLVALLAVVIAEGYATDVRKGFTGGTGPPMPQMQWDGGGGDFQQQMQRTRDHQQAMQKWHEQMRAEQDKQFEKMRAAERGMRTWSNLADLGIYLLHAGALVLPGLATMKAYSAAARRSR